MLNVYGFLLKFSLSPQSIVLAECQSACFHPFMRVCILFNVLIFKD